ncbi:MFS transporter [Streptomyces sp. NPDC050560]|uniref:MFS transporter n=1 Tax=Streptomyces sp. NPDC050560 TaxID=3365630 RepID=UPI0037AEE789
MTENTVPGQNVEKPVRSAADSATHHPAVTLAIIGVCYLMITLDSTVVTIALPDLQSDLGFSSTSLSWVINAYTMAFGGLLLFGGRLGDMMGRRRALMAGTAVFTLASLLGGLAGTATLLVAARALQGVGAALIAPSTLALIASSFEEGPARHRALSVYSATAGAGGSLGLILGGLLTDVSWRLTLFVNVPLGVLAVLAAPRFLREPERHRARLDIVGTVTATAGMVGLVYAFIRVPTAGWGDSLTIGSFLAAGVLLAGFLWTETRAGAPIMPLWLFTDRSRSGAYLNILLLTGFMLGTFFFLTQFVQDVLGFGSLEAGLAFLPMTLGTFATASQAPKLLRKFGAKRLMAAGAVLVGCASLWFTRLGGDSGYASGVLGPLILTGIGIGLSYMPMSATVLAAVPPKDSGSASGVLQTMMQLGAALGLAILVTVFGTASGNAHGPAGASPETQARHAFTEGIQSAFAAGGLFVVCSLLVILFLIRSRPKTPENAG